MFRRFSVDFALISICLDALIVASSLAVATLLRPFLSNLPFAAPIPTYKPIPFLLYPLFAFAWVGIFLLLSIYDSRRNVRIVDEITSLTLGSILAGVALAGALYLSFREISRLLFLFFMILSFLGLLSWRMAVRLALGKRKAHSVQLRRVLIVGAGPVGRELRSKILNHSLLGLHPIGFLDDDPRKRSQDKAILGSVDEIRQVIAKYDIDDVVIALPQRAHLKVNRLVTELHDQAVKIWVIPDYFSLSLHKAVAEDFAGIPMLDLRAPALGENQRIFKRAFDLILTLLFLPVGLVMIAIIALAIRLEKPTGPIFFWQQRVGENGRLFNMLKFRTMVPEAEILRHLVEVRDQQGNLIHKVRDDPRVTRVGRFLRRTSLDELPQIINILKGEMSVVGPRPELPYLVQEYQPWQRARFAVPQGVTGWWQVNGRSDKPMHLHTEDDLYYVQNYSLLLDLRIMLKTILVVLRGKGAF